MVKIPKSSSRISHSLAPDDSQPGVWSSSSNHLQHEDAPSPSSWIFPFALQVGDVYMFLVELGQATRNEQDVPLFSFIEESVAWLDQAQGNYANFHIVFMVRLTFFLGFSPNLESGGMAISSTWRKAVLYPSCLHTYITFHQRGLYVCWGCFAWAMKECTSTQCPDWIETAV